MESFFALLQKNVLDRRRWRTRNELHDAIGLATAILPQAGQSTLKYFGS